MISNKRFEEIREILKQSRLDDWQAGPRCTVDMRYAILELLDELKQAGLVEVKPPSEKAKENA